MTIMQVQPRPTPAERSEERIDVDVEESLAVMVATIEDWVEPRQAWDMQLSVPCSAWCCRWDLPFVKMIGRFVPKGWPR